MTDLSALENLDLVPTGVREAVAQATRLGLSWILRPGTITRGASTQDMRVMLDGDAASIGAIGLCGPLPYGDRVMAMIVPPSGVYIIGEVAPNQFRNTQVLNLRPPGSLSTSSGSFVDITGASIAFSKWSDSSNILCTLNTTSYASAAGAVFSAAWGVRINGVDSPIAFYFFNTASDHRSMGGSVLVSGVPSGTYTVQVRWLCNNAARAVVMDNNDLLSLVVHEDL